PGHRRTSSALHPLPAIRTHTGSHAATQAPFSSTDSHAAASAWPPSPTMSRPSQLLQSMVSLVAQLSPSRPAAPSRSGSESSPHGPSSLHAPHQAAQHSPGATARHPARHSLLKSETQDRRRSLLRHTLGGLAPAVESLSRRPSPAGASPLAQSSLPLLEVQHASTGGVGLVAGAGRVARAGGAGAAAAAAFPPPSSPSIGAPSPHSSPDQHQLPKAVLAALQDGDRAQLQGCHRASLQFYHNAHVYGFLPSFLALLRLNAISQAQALLQVWCATGQPLAFSSFISHVCHTDPSHLCSCHQAMCLTRKLGAQWQLAAASVLQGLLPESGSEHLKSAAAAPAPSLTPRIPVAAASQQPSMVLVQEAAHMGGSPSCHAAPAKLSLETSTEVPHSATAGVQQELGELLRAAQHQLALACQTLAFLSYTLHAHNSTLAPALRQHQRHQQDTRGLRERLPQQQASQWSPPAAKQPSGEVGSGPKSGGYLALPSCHAVQKGSVIGLPIPIVWHSMLPMVDGANAAADDDASGLVTAVLQPPTSQAGAGPLPDLLPPSLAPPSPDPPTRQQTYPCRLRLCHAAFDVSHLSAVAGAAALTASSHGSHQGFSPAAKAVRLLIQPSYATGLLVLAHACDDAVQHYLRTCRLTSSPAAAAQCQQRCAQGSSAAPASPTSIHYGRGSGGGDVEPVGASQQQEVARGLTRVNWTLLHHYPGAARSAALWKELGDWRKAVLLAFTLHRLLQTSHAAQTSSSPSAAHPPATPVQAAGKGVVSAVVTADGSSSSKQGATACPPLPSTCSSKPAVSAWAGASPAAPSDLNLDPHTCTPKPAPATSPAALLAPGPSTPQHQPWAGSRMISAMASGKAKRPPAAPPPGSCLEIGWSILEDQMGPGLEAMELQAACRTLHELVAIPLHALGQQSEVYLCLLKKVATRLMDLLPKRVCITLLLPSPCPAPSALLSFSLSSIRTHLQCHLAQLMAQAHAQLKLAHSCSLDSRVSLKEVLQAMLGGAETRAVIKLLLLWSGAFSAECCEQALEQLLASSSHHELLDPFSWTAANLLPSLHSALTQSALLPPHDTACVLSAAAQLIQAAEAGGHPDFPRRSVGQRSNWGRSSAAGACVGAAAEPAHSPGASKPGRPAATGPSDSFPSLINLNELSLLVEVTQLMGTLLQCLQPHVASALPLLPQAHGSLLLGSIPAVAAAQESAAGQDQDGVLEGSPPLVSCLPPTAVADHLQALAALDWALVCRAHVAALLHHLQLRCTQSQDAMPVDACQWLASIPAVQPLLPALPAAMELPSSAVAPPPPLAKDVDAAAKPTKEQPSHSQSNLRDLILARGEPVRGCVLGPELNARCIALSTITISELVAGAQAKDTSCSTYTSSPGTSAHCCVHLSPSHHFAHPPACSSIAQQDAEDPGNKLGTGSLPDLELLLLQWAIALVFADTYHPETELQATVLHVLSQLQGQALDPALVTEMSTALRERAVYNGRLAEQIRRLLAAAHTSQPAAGADVSSNEGAATQSTSAAAGAATAVPDPPRRQPCVRVGNRIVRGPDQTAMEVGRACLTALHQYATASSTPPSLQPCGSRAGSVTQQPSKAGSGDSCCVSVLCCALHMLQANPGQFRQTTPCDVPGVLAQLSLCFANPFRPCLAVKGTGSSLMPSQHASDQLQATPAVINALQAHCPQPQAFDAMMGTQHPPGGPCHQEQHCQQTTAPTGQQQHHHHVQKQGTAGDMQQQEGVAASTQQELWALLSLGSWRLVGAADWAWGPLRPCPQPQLAVQLPMPDVPCTGSPCHPPPAALQQADQPDQPSRPDKLDHPADPPDHSVEPRLGCPVEDKLGSMASLRGHDGCGLASVNSSVNSSACHSPNVMSPLPLPPSLSALQPGATRPSYLHHHLLRQQARASGSRHAGKPRPAPLAPPPSQLSPPASPRCDSASSPSDSPSTWAGSDPPDTESGAGSRAALQCKITAAGADSCACQVPQPGSLAQPQPGSDPASPLQTCASSAELELDSCRVISGPCRLSASGTGAVTDDVISSLLDKAAGQLPGVRGKGSGSLLLGADHTDRQTSQHTHPCHPNSAPAVADASQAGQGHYSALNAVAKVDGLSQLPLGQQKTSAADHPPAVRLQSRPATGKADVMLQAVNQAALAAAHLAAAAGQKARAASAFVRSTGLPMLATASSSRAAAVPSPNSPPAHAATAKLSSGHPHSRPQSPISAVLHPPTHQPGAQEGVTTCHAAGSGQASAGAAPGRGLSVMVPGAQRGIGSSPSYAMERYSQEPARNTQARLSGRRHSSRLAAPDKGWGHDALTRTASLFAARPAWAPSSPAAGRFHTAAAAEAGGRAHGSAHPDNRRQGSVRVRLADFLHGSASSRALQQAALSTAAPGSPTAHSASRALRRSLEAGAMAVLHPAAPPTLPAPHPLLGLLSSHDPFAAPGPQSWAPAFDSTTRAHPDSVAARMQGYAGAEAAGLRSTFPRSSSATSSINPLYEALRQTSFRRRILRVGYRLSTLAAMLPCCAPAQTTAVGQPRCIRDGDLVIVYEGHSSMKAVHVNSKERFDNKFGSFAQKDWLGLPFGSKVHARSGVRGWVHLLAPSPTLWSLVLPHRTQILYIADISMVCLHLDLAPGCVVLESGTGSASLTHSLVRAVAPLGHVHTFEFHSGRADEAAKELARNGLSQWVTVRQRNIEQDGFPCAMSATSNAALAASQQPEQQPEQQPGQQPEQQPGQQPEQQPEQQPGQQPEQQPEQQPGQQPEQQPGQQPEQQPEQQPGQQPDQSPQQHDGGPDLPDQQVDMTAVRAPEQATVPGLASPAPALLEPGPVQEQLSTPPTQLAISQPPQPLPISPLKPTDLPAGAAEAVEAVEVDLTGQADAVFLDLPAPQKVS
ncbi:hypothetical protein QJQ45_014247, partial [Haematococcus lacustris]